MDDATVDYYSENADAVVARYESMVSELAASFGTAFRPKSKILDIGCGSGRDLAALSAQGHDCFGVDASPEMVRRAESLHPELRGKIVCAALPDCKPPFGGGFDGVLCSAVLMHLPLDQQEAAAAAIGKCLKKNGRLLYLVPNKRLDVIAANRDANGRLFTPDPSGRWQSIFETLGFRLVSKWHAADSLGRDTVDWLSVLMELEDF